MNKSSKIAALSIALMLLATPVFGAEGPAVDVDEEIVEEVTATLPGPEGFSIYLGVAFGTGMIVIGAAYGIGRIGTAAVESMARQPEVARSVQTAMLIACALIEGFTFFGLAVCLLKVLNQFMG